MSKELIIEEILADGKKEIGRLIEGELSIGRDEADGLVVDNHAVSRNHGRFLRVRSHWFYKDMGSTNGSWKNGRPVREGQMSIVRPGDVLQLADTPLRVSAPDSGAFPQFANSTLIVFRDGEFADEYPLPEFGRALVIGGSQADLPLTEAIDELPRLVIERRGEKVCAFSVAEGPPITLNDESVSETVNIEDGDFVKVGQYSILFNDPKPPATSGQIPQPQVMTQQPASMGAGMGQAPSLSMGDTGSMQVPTFKTWDDGAPRQDPDQISATASGRFTFGRDMEEDIERTVAIDPSEVEARLAGYNMHPSSRYHSGVGSSGGSLGSLEDKLIVLIGFVLLLFLIALVVWYVFLT